MKLTEDELDSWFIELPFDDKKNFHRLWYDRHYGFIEMDSSNWDKIFKCESNTPIERS